MKKMYRNVLSFVAIVAFLVLAAASSGKKGEANNQNGNDLFANYFEAQEKKIPLLKDDQKKRREERIADLKRNEIYVAIVTKEVVSVDYLPVLHALGNCIRNAGEQNFGLHADIEKKLNESELAFATKMATLIYLGGFTKEMALAFDRYRGSYRYYGKAGTVHYDANGNQIGNVKDDYDLTPIFVALDVDDKKLANSIYETVENGINKWLKADEPLLYPQLSDRTSYNNYLKKIDPNSPYILNYDYELTAIDLLAIYDENEVAADQKYKGKKILITGKVESIGKDIIGSSYVVLKGGGYFINVHCTIKDENEAASIRKGKVYTLLGECEGSSILGGVMLNGCKVVY